MEDLPLSPGSLILSGRVGLAKTGPRKLHETSTSPKYSACLTVPPPSSGMPSDSLKGGHAALMFRSKGRHHGRRPRPYSPNLQPGGPLSILQAGGGLGFGTSPRFPPLRQLAEPETLDSETSPRITPRPPTTSPRKPANRSLDKRLRAAVAKATGGRDTPALFEQAAGKETPGAFCFFFPDEASLHNAEPTALAFVPQEKLEKMWGPLPSLPIPNERVAPVVAVLMREDGAYVSLLMFEASQRRKCRDVEGQVKKAPRPQRPSHPQRRLLEARKELEEAQRQVAQGFPGPGFYAARDTHRPSLASGVPNPAKPSPCFHSPAKELPKPSSGWLPGGLGERSQWLRFRASSPRELINPVLTAPDPDAPSRPLSYVPLRGIAVRTQNRQIL